MLYSYIEDNFTIERATMIIYSLDLLTKFNVSDVESKLEDAAFNREDLDNPGRIATINQIIFDELTEVLNLHDIVILDLTDDLILVYNMVDTLKKVSEEYDANYILENVDTILTESNEAIDVYANLVGLVTDTRPDSVYDNVFVINDSIVDNIVTLLDGKKQDESQLADTGVFIDRYKHFLKGRRFGLVFELVKANVEIGTLDFNNLFLILEDGLDQLNREDLIFELVSLMLISATELEDLPALAVKVSRLMGDTEASAKQLLSGMKEAYLANTGLTL